MEFSSFFELSKIEASSFQYSKNKYDEFEVKKFTEKDELENSFHDDFKSINYIYPNLKKGSKSKLKYTEKIKDPRFLNSFYLAEFFPIEKGKYTIAADNDINLEFKEFNTEGYNINFSKEVKRKKTIYTWEINGIDAFKYEERATTYKKRIPHIVPRITSYTTNNNEVKILETTSDLYNWYYSLTKNINKEAPSTELVKITQNLIEGKTSNLEKVKAIYYWVQQNIKYIAFEYELGGFIPREANKVLSNKYGDCKDNSSILQEMLEIAGIEGNLTWIGTRSIPYSYEEMPTPKVDNHMILTYTENNKTYYLDATGRYLSIDYPSSFIQGKEALVNKGFENFEIKKVPVIEAGKNLYRDSTQIELYPDFIKGKNHLRATGYHKNMIFSFLEECKNDNDVKELYKSIFEKGNNKFLIESFKNFNAYEYDKDFEVNYNFKIADYAKYLGDEIYINLNLNKFLTHIKPQKDRITEIEYDFKNKLEYYTQLKIPEGYKVGYLPENININHKLLKASISYKHDQEDNTINYTHTIELNFLSLNLTEQKEILGLIDEVEKSYNEIIVLKKKEL